MLLICYGMQKSASTFAFQLSKDIAHIQNNQWQLNEQLPEDIKPLFIADELTETITRISKYIKDEQVYVIKTHCPLNDEVKDMIQEGHVKATVSIRDPYDIVVSLKDAGENERQKETSKQRQYFTKIKSYEDALKLMPPIMKNARSWLEYSGLGLLKIPFYKIAQEPTIVATEIAQHLDVTTDVSKIVDSYMSNKKSIYEFNVGKVGRGKQLIHLSEENSIKQDMDRFIQSYL